MIVNKINKNKNKKKLNIFINLWQHQGNNTTYTYIQFFYTKFALGKKKEIKTNIFVRMYVCVPMYIHKKFQEIIKIFYTLYLNLSCLTVL